jgi:hypothetical protein
MFQVHFFLTYINGNRSYTSSPINFRFLITYMFILHTDLTIGKHIVKIL